jgi:hypothetical protein
MSAWSDGWGVAWGESWGGGDYLPTYREVVRLRSPLAAAVLLLSPLGG